MKSEPILVHHIRPTPDDVCLRRLIEFFGLNCGTVDTSTFSAELGRAAEHDLCVLANAATIHQWCHGLGDPATALDNLCHKASSVFVYGFAPETSAYLAASLSDGAIAGVRRFTRTDLRYQVNSSQRQITREFSGLLCGGVRNSTDFGFVCGEHLRDMVPLISIEGMPFWVQAEKNGCKVFLLACSAVADLEESVSCNIDVTKYFSRLLPAAMFIKSAFKGRCWHSKHRFANFIIDDPPLKRSYGYLNYRDLVSTMDEANFASTIAFIPWNYDRTDSKVTQLFRQRPDRLSLCVHGCDHTAREFATADLAVLNFRVQLASARMDGLRRQSGLLYSKTMVFPQGCFSTQALQALKANGYLAAVNSSASAAAPTENRPLALADFLQPAVTRYGGVPVFLRRYPRELEHFAFDLFFEKPALVVEHQGYFKDGARLVKFISRLNSLEGLQWRGLHETMTRSYLEREISNETTACKLYTNHQVIANHDEHERTFVVTKGESDELPVQDVLVNGQPTEFTLDGGRLQFTIPIPALSSREVKIVYSNVLPRVGPRRALASRSRVWTRRMLSEFRDNVLCRSKLLLAGASALQRGLSGSIAG